VQGLRVRVREGKQAVKNQNSRVDASAFSRVVETNDSMDDYDKLDPRMRELIQSAPLSIDAPTALAHQRAVGVEQACKDVIARIQQDFPGYIPPEPKKERLAGRDLTLRRRR
jgi:hypothetical protein